VQLFIQFAPYDVSFSEAAKYIKCEESLRKVAEKKMNPWEDPDFCNVFVQRCFGIVEEFCPGFSQSVVYQDVLSPVPIDEYHRLSLGKLYLLICYSSGNVMWLS